VTRGEKAPDAQLLASLAYLEKVGVPRIEELTVALSQQFYKSGVAAANRLRALSVQFHVAGQENSDVMEKRMRSNYRFSRQLLLLTATRTGNGAVKASQSEDGSGMAVKR
jgi:hypothetical protein